MPNIVIAGAQWGDEGKGKIVDLLTERVQVVARYNGGHNAGHTILLGKRKFVLHVIPSGILHPGILCVMGNGMVVDPWAFEAELATERLDSVRQPAEARALCGIRAADAVVDDLDQPRAIVRSHAHDHT